MSIHSPEIQGMKISLRKRFGAQVKALRIASGLSQEALADLCGFARSYMSRIERGEANPSLDAIEVLSGALSLPAARLFEELGDVALASQVVEVPFASDGTCFHPGLASFRDRSYKVGEKDAPLRFHTFEEALAYLRTMKKAKWWRANQNGNLGLVSAIRWAPLPKELC